MPSNSQAYSASVHFSQECLDQSVAQASLAIARICWSSAAPSTEALTTTYYFQMMCDPLSGNTQSFGQLDRRQALIPKRFNFRSEFLR